jgi:superfamily II DNA/RNA helicase
MYVWMGVCTGDHVLIHAETGSGKTLAYTLPVLQRLNGHAPRQVGSPDR